MSEANRPAEAGKALIADDPRAARLEGSTLSTPDETPENPDSPWSFPCRFPIKAMGLAEDDIRGCLVTILQANGANPHPDDLVWITSAGGKYISVTATIHATSKAQLETIYQALNGDTRIRWVL